jgi:membrane associated rhomboid family serine protease
MRSNAGFLTLTQATFTHLDYFHLFGNLLFLIVFGIWVEQRAGFLVTFMTFFAGSLTGIAIQLSAHPQTPCMGASAGVSALMGSFFIYFLKAELQFLFTFAFVYYKKFWSPILWAFPLFFLASDIVAVMGHDSLDLVAHAAHVGGLVVGLAIALFMNLALPLTGGALFYQEERPLFVLAKSKDPEALWHAIKLVGEWNMQNWQALTVFLRRLQTAHIVYQDKARNQILQKKVASYIEFIFRRGTVDEIIHVLQLVPTSLDLPRLIDPIPVSQVLYLADVTANRKIFELALPMYRLALTKVNDAQKKTLIRNAIHQIQNLSVDDKLEEAK